MMLSPVMAGAQTKLAETPEQKLSILLFGSVHPVRNGYQPNKIHAGIDFGDTGTDTTPVISPVNGKIVANTSACGKVAIFDGKNTVILAHMASRTSLAVGKTIAVGEYVGKAAMVLGGGCSATGPHLHIEIRTGNNPTMALPSNENGNTTLNPTEYLVRSDPQMPPDRDAILDFNGSSIVGFLNDHDLRLVCNPNPPYTELVKEMGKRPTRPSGGVDTRTENILPILEYLNGNCKVGKPNPLLLLLSIAANGDIDLNNLKEGNVRGKTILLESLSPIFRERRNNGVYREGTNEVETSITLRVPSKLAKEIFLKSLAIARSTGSDRVNVYVDNSFGGTPSSLPNTEFSIEVRADRMWVDTGIDVSDKRISIEYMSGQWSNGGKNPIFSDARGGGNWPGLIVPNAPFRSLVGKTANRTFFIGNHFEGFAGSGKLFLSINDTSDFTDNLGSIIVRITIHK